MVQGNAGDEDDTPSGIPAILHFVAIEAGPILFIAYAHYTCLENGFLEIKGQEYGVAQMMACLRDFFHNYALSASRFKGKLDFQCSDAFHPDDDYTVFIRAPELDADMQKPASGSHSYSWTMGMHVEEMIHAEWFWGGVLVPFMLIALWLFSVHFVFFKADEERQGNVLTLKWYHGSYITRTWKLERDKWYRRLVRMVLVCEFATQSGICFALWRMDHSGGMTWKYTKAAFFALVAIARGMYSLAFPTQARHPYYWERFFQTRGFKRNWKSFLTSNDYIAMELSDAMSLAARAGQRRRDRKDEPYRYRLEKMISVEGDPDGFWEELEKIFIEIDPDKLWRHDTARQSMKWNRIYTNTPLEDNRIDTSESESESGSDTTGASPESVAGS